MVGEMVEQEVKPHYVDIVAPDYSDPIVKYCIENGVRLIKEMTRDELEKLYG